MVLLLSYEWLEVDVLVAYTRSAVTHLYLGTQVQFKPGLVSNIIFIKALILAGVQNYHF
jgi:hypothetical protein